MHLVDPAQGIFGTVRWSRPPFRWLWVPPSAKLRDTEQVAVAFWRRRSRRGHSPRIAQPRGAPSIACPVCV